MSEQITFPSITPGLLQGLPHKERKRRQQKDRIANQKRLGLCVWSYCQRPHANGKVYCEFHADNCNRRNKNTKAKKTGAGVCLDCSATFAIDGSRFCEKHRRAAKARDLKRLYGISMDVFDVLYEHGNGCCWICGNPFRTLATGRIGARVDHDHSQRHVRGLLCNNCNPGIGFFRDDPAILASAIRYLDRTPGHFPNPPPGVVLKRGLSTPTVNDEEPRE